MPLIVRWPGVTPPGSENERLVQNLDFAPTFLDVAGVDAPERMQGRSLVPLLRPTPPPAWREAVYYHYYEHPGVHNVQRHEGVRTGRWKLIHFYRINEWELYDLKNDPDELVNLYGDPAYDAITTELKRELERLRERYEVPPNDLGQADTTDEE